MNDDLKTKKELIQELAGLKRRIVSPKKSAVKTDKRTSALERDDKPRYIFENVNDAMIYLDKKGFITEVNKEAVRIFGGLKEELVGSHFTNIGIFSPEDIPGLLSSIKTVLRGKHTNLNLRIKNKKQEIFFIECSASPMKTGGKIVGMIAIIRDVTERMRAEEALRESEEHYRLLVENATEGILVAQDRYVKFANPRIEEITSYSREELLSKPFLEFVHPDDREFVMDNQLKRLKGEPIPEAYEIRMINKYGETRWLKIGGVIITWEGKPASLNFVVDVTETKRLRELESRAQRLETAGQIAGQVAHDFNNLLAPLITYPEFVRRDLSKNHPALPYLKDIEKAAHKIADINQQLLTLGRRGHYNLVPLNLNDVIGETLNELKPFPNTLVIETELAGDLLNIKAGRAQIHRVLSNMINNARDATQDIGRIVIKTENFYAENVAVAYGRVPRGEYVKLTISDTGHGISEGIIQKIFDPFFTTKTADKKRGSGLGLSVVDSVVKDHFGFLDLRSKVGEGTSFFFYFPITRENIDDRVSGQIMGGNESVLVVDDDDIQRKVSLKILASLGYTVTTVESGEKALELLRQKPHDLLFLDMIMTPGIDGTETLRQALEINPLQKAIIISGFAETERVQEALKLGAGAFIRKPITIKKMAAAIRKELDKKEEIFVF
ncbi:MAG: PAS domain S-box protein [Candidatus Zixiibacteriota bacterium]|nr:MAG: PAS domain S-box protein [candidate division Zixibacteria bacterium]